MSKESYLLQAEVLEFTDWFAGHLASDSRLAHHYVKPGGRQVEFSNLANALVQYDWPFSVTGPGNAVVTGSTFAENKAALASLKAQLDMAIRDKDDARICAVAMAVMQWGGVSAGNVRWLRRNQAGLAALLAQVAGTLAQGHDERTAFEPDLRFNAGMTKVYSLWLENFIIYDSRVAAALAWFVMQWSRGKNASAIPANLNFPCMPAHEGINPEIRKIRNPGVGRLAFQKLHNRPSLHAQWNLRASWLIEAALDTARKKNGLDMSFQTDGVRAVEAALFMWGYDLGRNSPWLNVPENNDIQDDDADAEKSLEDLLATQQPLLKNAGVTHGKQLPFAWHFDEKRDMLVIKRAVEQEDEFSLADIFSVLHGLYDRFGDDMIPLANNVITLTDALRLVRAERRAMAYDGLGMAILDLPGSTVLLGQAASYLGPILEKLDQFSWNGKRRGIGYYFKTLPPANLNQLRDLLSEYAE